MTRRRTWKLVAIGVLALAVVAVVRNQVRVYRRGVARSAEMRQRLPPPGLPADVVRLRQAMYDALQPVSIRNCALERFGGRSDGAYLMCGNLLDAVQAGYSYGIGGHDEWGCDIAKASDVLVHQYDCFNLDRPWCWSGDTAFHEECVGGATETIDGRRFDTILQQVRTNGDAGKRLAMKIDIEGAEWETILAMADETLNNVDQMAVEFHWSEDQTFGWAHDPRYLAAVERLKQFMVVGHIHFNNMNCVGNLAPFPSSAFEVLFVSKRLAVVDTAPAPPVPHPADTRTRWWVPDCQVSSAR